MVFKAKVDRDTKKIEEVKEPDFKDLDFEEQVKVVDKKLKAEATKGIQFDEAFQKLSPEEQVVVYKYKEYVQQQEEARKLERERIAAEERAKIEKEFEETKKESPEEILDANVKGKNAGPSGLQTFLAKLKVSRTKKRALKKGGQIIIKAYIGRGYEIIYSKTPVRFVEFKSKNEAGEEVRNVTRITRNKGHLKGSSIPVHLCVEGIANSFDPFEGIETNMSAEYFNKLLQGEFQSGLATGLAIRPNKHAGFDMAKITPILFLAVIAGLGIMAYYLMQIYEIVSKLGGV
jgi:hypothetical protein